MTFQLLSRALTVVAMALSIPAAAPAAFFNFAGGQPDNFAPGPDPTSPSPGLQLQHGGGPFNQYDQATPDTLFLETFDNLPCCIVEAHMEMVVRPNGGPGAAGFSGDDTIQFSFTDSGGNQSPTYWQSHFGDPSSSATLFNQTWDTNNFTTSVPLTFDLSNLPTPQLGSSNNLIGTMNPRKYLDVVIGDNTEVDFMVLQIRTGLDGDINGDGCVDSTDVSILSANLGQPVPNGMGDPNGDGIYDINDLGLVSASFGQCCDVPEPHAAMLAVLGLACVAGRRRGK